MADAPYHRRPSSSGPWASCAGGLVLGMEDSGSRMSRLGKSELVQRPVRC